MSAVAESPIERLIRREQQIAAHRPAGFPDYAPHTKPQRLRWR